jgi:hypothetical protein
MRVTIVPPGYRYRVYRSGVRRASRRSLAARSVTPTPTGVRARAGAGSVHGRVRKYVTRSHRLTDSQQNALFGTSDGAPQRIKNTFPRAAA